MSEAKLIVFVQTSFTASFIEQLPIGAWTSGGPRSPQRSLNAYVRVHIGFTPIDCDDALLAVEPEVPSLRLQGFPWEKLRRGTAFLHSTCVTASYAVDHCQDVRLVQELSTSLYTYITRDKYPMWYKERQDLVEYGVARLWVKGRRSSLTNRWHLSGFCAILRQKDSQSIAIFELAYNPQRDRRSKKRFCYRVPGSFEWTLACLTSFRLKEMEGPHREPEGTRTRGLGSSQ
jgi:hypothetical protein